MKIYNQKGFRWGLFWTLFSGVTTLSVLLRWEGIEDLSNLVVSLPMCIWGLDRLIRSLSRASSQRELHEVLDERDQLLELKSEAKASNIMSIILLSLIVVGIAGYSITERPTFAFLTFIPLLYTLLHTVVYCIVSAYYEQRF